MLPLSADDVSTASVTCQTINISLPISHPYHLDASHSQETTHTMRTAYTLGRFFLNHGKPKTTLNPSPFRQSLQTQSSGPSLRWYSTTRTLRLPKKPVTRRVLLYAALGPAAFVSLLETDTHDGQTGEQHMLEASRADIEKGVPEDVHGIVRVWKTFIFVLDAYFYEPMCTTLRFLHLVVIFVPVIIAVPAIWIGSRQKDKDHERSGTLWWYGFLVRSMERAGPAFIKACPHTIFQAHLNTEISSYS